jgi:putative glutamine amidotransferase
MAKVKILLSGSSKFQNYTAAVEAAGGIADASYLPAVDTSYDGLILCGGYDINPKHYDQENNGSRDIDDARDEAEIALLKAYVEAGKPVLGICRGLQLINVFFGGSLHQDIPTAEDHSSSVAGQDMVHKVQAEPDSIARKLYEPRFSVNSNHHQAIDYLGNDLKVTMISEEDGVIEGIEHEKLPIFAVQWHPERMCMDHKRSDTVDGLKVFEYFVELCRKGQ